MAACLSSGINILSLVSCFVSLFEFNLSRFVISSFRSLFVRPYLLRRQKNDVEKSLAPLEETIVWVEMTIFQKKTYKAILEGNREMLVGGVTGAAMPRLINLQMELRKCCNHPYLIKGVEAASAPALLASQDEVDHSPRNERARARARAGAQKWEREIRARAPRFTRQDRPLAHPEANETPALLV